MENVRVHTSLRNMKKHISALGQKKIYARLTLACAVAMLLALNQIGCL